MDKDEVVAKLRVAEGKQQANLKNQATLKEQVKERDGVQKKLEVALKEVRRMYQEAQEAFIQSRDLLKQSDNDSKWIKLEVESLQRELARIVDAEQIDADYTKMVDILREGSLSATWRKENREDGLGAFPYQIDGAIHLAVAKRAILGDKRGLGKSLTSLVFADLSDSMRTIVISPQDTQENYIREVSRWTPHRMPIKIGQMPKGQREFILNALQQSPTFTLILNYEAWRKDDTLIQQLIDLKADTVIADEAHMAKESRSLIAKGLKELVFGFNMCPGCDIPRVTQDKERPWVASCLCGYSGHIVDFCSVKQYLPATGTPILNSPKELFPHLHLIDPKGFPDERKYLYDFTVKRGQRTVWKYGAEEQLMKKIGPRYLARNKTDAGIIIPPNQEIEHLLTMQDMKERYPNQWKAYTDARDAAMIALDPGNSDLVMSFPYLITQLMRLRQILVWPNAVEYKVLDPDTYEPTGELVALNVKESFKLDETERLIREFTEEGERVVVFSQFRSGLHILQERLGDQSVLYDGTVSRHRRNEIQLDFDATIRNPEPRWNVLLGVYKSGGTGLNFTGASQGILMDREWNPGKEDQAVGRWDRIGQTRDTQTHHMIVEPSVDIWMKELIEEKRNMTDSFEDMASVYQRTYDKLRNGEI